MDETTWKRIEHLFYEAIEHAPAERSRYLDEACGDDRDLRRGVDTLLAHHTQTGHLFNAPEALVEELLRELAGSLSADSAVEGRTIGPYRLEREIGSGGMGRVFLARREDLPKKVALKLVREPLASPDRIRRFEFEQRVLASLEHPHIAPLLDAGVTDDGAPYFAMELVDGEPLPAFCDRRRLTIAQRLRLFLDVCAAVRYAHAHLIVHRDIKPSNILVTRDGRPKLLDFGVAKLLTPDGSADLTGTGTRVFTPSYASPEQLMGGPVSTGSDVYQLGALLYALLTGRAPLDVEGKSPAEAERIIREHEPPPASSSAMRRVAAQGSTGAAETWTPLPSSPRPFAPPHATCVAWGPRFDLGRLRRPRLTPAAIAARRSTTSERLRRQLKGDIDNIVLKALEKQPQRRYASVEALANDIERFLQGRPVLAREGGRAYRFRKLARRHRWAIGAAAAFVLMLGGYAATVSIQAGRIRRALGVAELETEKAEQVTEFLIGLFEAGDPTEHWGVDLTGGELLARGVRRAEQLSDRPELQARLLEVIGRTYRRLARPDEARPLLERALALRETMHGTAHADVAASLHDLGALARTMHDYPAAESLLTRALTLRRALLGDEHEPVAATLVELGRLAQARNQFDRAESRLEKALAIRRTLLGDEQVETGTTLSHLGMLLWRTGDYARAEPALREALAIRRGALGDDHIFVATDLNNLGLVLLQRGDLATAESYFREALAIDRRLLGDGSSFAATTLSNLAGSLREQHEYIEADSLLQNALAIIRRLRGDAHPKVALFLMNRGRVHLERGSARTAEPLLRRSLERYRKLHPDGAWQIAVVEGRWGESLAALGRFGEAEPRMVASFSTLLEFWGRGHRHTQEARQRLARFYESRGRHDVAAFYRTTTTTEPDGAPPGHDPMR